MVEVGLIPIAVAFIPFVIRLLYLVAFRYRSRLFQPPKYPQVKKLLNSVCLVAIGGAVLALATSERLGIAVALVAVLGITEHLARFLAYRRAVNDAATRFFGDYPPDEQHKAAVACVDELIRAGERL